MTARKPPVNLSSPSRAEWEAELQQRAVMAIHSSIAFGDVMAANRLLEELSRSVRGRKSKAALTRFCEKWGALTFSNRENRFNYRRNPKLNWSAEYGEAVASASCFSARVRGSVNDAVVDVEEEVRKLLRRLDRLANESAKTLLHKALLAMVREACDEYRRAKGCDPEFKSKTLFDQSTKQNTVRASKYAKCK
jgi:hypothetical protein